MEEVLESGLVLAISCLMGQPDMRAAVRLGMGLLKTPSNKDLPEPITNNKNVEDWIITRCRGHSKRPQITLHLSYNRCPLQLRYNVFIA